MYAHKYKLHKEIKSDFGQEMEIEFKLVQLATRVNKIAVRRPHRAVEVGKIKM